MRLTSKKGFSIVELVIAMGMLSVLAYGSYAIFKNFFDAARKQENIASSTVTEAVGTRMIWEDLAQSAPSLNNLSMLDDASLKFFDYLSDVKCQTNCSRNIVWDLQNGAAREIVFLVSDLNRGTSQIFHPSNAYNATPPPAATPFVAGSLAYSDTKLLATLDTLDRFSGLAGSDRNTGLDKNYALLMFYSPVNGRPDATMSTPPRYPFFVAQVQQNIMNANFFPTGMNDPFVRTHPLKTSQLLTTLDAFFRTLPVVGGSQSFAMVRPVKLVRYRSEIDKTGKSPALRIKKSEFEGGSINKFGNEMTVAYPVRRLRFTRTNISSPVIQVKIDPMGDRE